MKVLIVDLSGKGGVARGGASRVASNLFYELRKYGIKTYFIGYKNDYMRKDSNTFLLSGGTAQQKARDFLSRAKLNSMISDTKLGRIAYYTAYSITGVDLNNAESWIAQIKPDIVLANSIQDYIVLKRLKPYLGSAKIVYIEHANASGSYPSAFDYNIMGLTFGTGSYIGLEGARKRVFSFFDAVIALNKEQFRNVRRYNRNVTIIHSSMLMDVTTPNKSTTAKIMKRLAIKKDEKVVLYFGRLLEAQKNVSALLLAFKAVKTPRLRLVIVGNGRSVELYERMIRDDSRINMVSGRITDDELAGYYSIADLYVLPSIFESFNATFIEAAHFGAALLLSKKAINEDIVERFGNRLYTFNPSDPDELREKIERYFKDVKLQKKLQSLSKDIAAEYSREKQMRGYAIALKDFHEKGTIPKATSA